MKKLISVLVASVALFALVLAGCDKKQKVEGISLDKQQAVLLVGESVTLSATVSPENATDKTVVWSTSDEKIATVADGAVQGVAAGKATITAASADGKQTATCEVTVETQMGRFARQSKEEHAKGELTVTTTFADGALTNKYTLEKVENGYKVTYSVQEFAKIEEDGQGGFIFPEEEIATHTGEATFDAAWKAVSQSGYQTTLPTSITLQGLTFADDVFTDGKTENGVFSANVSDPAKFLGKTVAYTDMKVAITYSAAAIGGITIEYTDGDAAVKISYIFA